MADARVDPDRLNSNQIDAAFWFVVSNAHAIEGTAYIHSFVVVEKTPCPEHNLLAPDNDIPGGVRMMQLAAELHETFVPVSNRTSHRHCEQHSQPEKQLYLALLSFGAAFDAVRMHSGEIPGKPTDKALLLDHFPPRTRVRQHGQIALVA